MNWSGLIGNVAGTIFRQYGAWRAGKEAIKGVEGAERVTEESRRRAQGYQDPYLQFGEEGMDTYRRAMERYDKLLEGEFDYKKTPGYKFRLEEGLKSIGIADGEVNQRNLSGSQLKSIQRYTQDYATSDYTNEYNRYMTTLGQYLGGAAGQVNVGQGAATVSTQAETGYGQMFARLQERRGNLRAGIHLGQSSAAATGVENFFGTSGGFGGGMGGTSGGGGGANAQSVEGGMMALGGGQSGGGGGMSFGSMGGM